MSDIENGMATAVQTAKAKLIALLTAEERKTTPAAVQCERDYNTFEDVARRIFEDRTDPRCMEVGVALADFQDAVNMFWEHAYRSGYHVSLASMWKKKRQKVVFWTTYDEVNAEVLWVLRRFITRFQPGAATLMTYSFLGVVRWLDEWVSTLSAQLEIPRATRREGFDPDWTVLFHTEFRNKGVNDALITALEETWSREMASTLTWLQLCRDAETEMKQ